MAKLPRTGVKRNERIGGRRRSKTADAPEVPTFVPSAEEVVEQPRKTAAIVEDPTEEAVRRMVEAAYT